MPRFECLATIDFHYTVTAGTKEEAEALLTEQLDPDWEGWIHPDDIFHPQIEQDGYSTDISCIGEEDSDDADARTSNERL
jgi:hypothetical protein